MPEGIKHLLQAPGKRRVVTIFGNEDTFALNGILTGELIQNFSEENNKQQNIAKKCVIHFINYSTNKSIELERFQKDWGHVYDDFELTLDGINKELQENVQKRHESQHVLIIENFATFSVLTSQRDCDLLGRFLRLCLTMFHRIFIFANQDTLTASEIGKVYDVAASITVITNLNADIFCCDLLKIREERRVLHEQTKFQVKEGELVELQEEVFSVGAKQQEDLLRSLTTFKLTVEDSEKESRSKLYLPYFDAQKIQIENPDDIDDYDDDDEEV